MPGDFGGTIFEGTAELSGFSSKGVLVTVYLCLKPLKKDRNQYLLQQNTIQTLPQLGSNF